MCGLYYPHPSNTIFISKEIKYDAEGENAYEENEEKLQVKKIQPTYLRISTRYDPCMSMMTSKNWDAVALFFKITTVLKLSPTLLTQKVPWPSVFSLQQNILSPKCPPFPSPSSSALLSSHILYSYPSQHLSLMGSFLFSTEIPSISMENTPHYLSCTYEASSLPSVFSLLHHQESIWIRGGLQGTQTKAENGPTTFPRTDLELTGLSHVGFGPQNY